MMPYKFEDLPDILGALSLRIENIERILKNNAKEEKEIDDNLLTIQDASKLLKLSVATIYSKVCRNELPVSKKGKRLYFLKSELLDWIKSGRIKTIAEIQKEVNNRLDKRY
ncbi:helix-turn-helix domain-containing protein [Flavobacterium sp. UW10123]|uniref:helix-turn-helix domain-containing protein n=1 Tax=Flavobacterium sp. UW10123 TaxID=3230800 RepID=UPI0033980C22